jgi:RNA polymerase sigma factor (sigma-70 family)
MNKIYTADEVDCLIADYKQFPSNVVSLEIYKAFEGFIAKYTNFLKYGTYRDNDADLKGLMRMLNITDVARSPVHNIFASWSSDDIFNELYLLFLQCINKFVRRKNGPYFTGYLYAYYKFMVKTWISHLSQDVLNTVKMAEVDDMNVLEEELLDVKEYENICLTEKSTLTQLEKLILHYHYGKRMSMNEIAELLDINRSYLNQLKNKAKDKLIDSGITLEDFEKEE